MLVGLLGPVLVAPLELFETLMQWVPIFHMVAGCVVCRRPRCGCDMLTSYGEALVYLY